MSMVAPLLLRPSVGRFYGRAALVAVALHALVLVVIVTSPESPSSGGGGMVLGRLSVSLGGSGEEGPRETENTPPPTEPLHDVPMKPTPIVAMPPPRTSAAAPAPRRQALNATPTPIPAQQVERETKPQDKPVEVTTLRQAETAGEEGDGKPLGASGVAIQTIGEGALAGAPGLGARDSANGDQRAAYLATVRARVERERFYPSAARRSHAEGQALLRLEIARDGRLIRVELLESSGSFHLDRAAKRMVEKAAPFAPPPLAPFTVRLPVAFALE